MKDVLRAFVRDQSANYAIMFALAMVPLAAIVGAGVDYAGAVSMKSSNQQAMDTATLAAVRESDATKARAVFDRYFADNGGSGSAVEFNFIKTAAQTSLYVKTQASRPNDFGKILGTANTPVSTDTEAVVRPTISDIKIRSDYAQGTYSKDMGLYAVFESDPGTPVKVASIIYTYDKTTGAKTINTTHDPSQYIRLENVANLYFQMDIDPTSPYVEYAPFLTLRTDNPATSHHLFVEGTQMETGVKVDLSKIIPCGKEVAMEWEDGGSFTAQDFGFFVTGKCTIGADAIAYLKQ